MTGADCIKEACLGDVSHPSPILPLALVVMGVSGSGKSTLGALMAQRLNCSFLEGDSYHSPEAVAKMAAGQALSDDDRWPWLDRLGAALGAAVQRDGASVTACSALRRVYRERLARAAGVPIRFVLLDPSSAELKRRVDARRDHFMPPSLLDSQLATLERPGTDEPALVLNGGEAPEILCGEAASWLAHPLPQAVGA